MSEFHSHRSVRANYLSGVIGKVWGVVSVFIFMPLYVRFLGPEAYALIGLYGTLQAVLAFADLGLGATLTREVARLSVSPSGRQRMRELTFTFETVGWLIAVLMATGIGIASPIIAAKSIQAHAIPQGVIRSVILMIGLVIGLQLPTNLYQAGATGLQRQVELNLFNVGIGMLRGIGSVLVLWLVSPTIQAFYCWMIVCGFVQAIMLRTMLWRCLRNNEVSTPPAFRVSCLTEIWRYSAAMAGLAVLGALVGQWDKLVVLKKLPLVSFGYYSIASVLSTVPGLVVGPLQTAVYPKLTQYVSLADDSNVRNFYHLSCQAVSVLVFSLCGVVILFAREIMMLWIRNAETVEHSWEIAAILLAGSAIQALQLMPYILQLAHGTTRIVVYSGVGGAMVLVPTLPFVAAQFGSIGVATGWLLFNLVSLVVVMPFVHARLLPGELAKWYINDIGLPLFAALVPALVARALFSSSLQPWLTVLWLAVVWSLSVIAGIVSAPLLRKRMMAVCCSKWRLEIGSPGAA